MTSKKIVFFSRIDVGKKFEISFRPNSSRFWKINRARFVKFFFSVRVDEYNERKAIRLKKKEKNFDHLFSSRNIMEHFTRSRI